MQKEEKLAGASAVLRAYFSYARKYRGYFATVFISGLLVQSAMLGAPLFLRQFFNVIASHTPDVSLEPLLIGFLVLTLLMYLLEWASRRLQMWANSKMTAQIMADLKVDAFSYLIKHSHNFFISRFSGSLTHKVSKYASQYETLFDIIFVSFIPTLYFIIGAVFILGFRHPLLGALLALWAVVFIAFQAYVSILQQPLRVKRAAAETEATATLADAISNQPAISLFAGTSFEIKNLRKAVEKWQKLMYRSWIAEEWTWAGIGLLMIAIEVGLLYAAMHLWAQGLLSVGDFVLIQAYLITSFDRMVSVNRELRRFYTSIADASEMITILQTPHEIVDYKSAKKLKVTAGEIWFDDVSFHFHTETSILKQFNVKIKGGERVALVGPSGAGKSTATKLLLRMYDLTAGEIKIDGQNIAKVTQDSLRESIAFVPQEPVLFHRTLMENIRYGRQHATDAEVLEAAKKANCHDFISALPLGYDTLVGERGIKLSGGERQRVAIARAILKNAPLLLLDEATSSLDSQSEMLIQQALDVLMEGKTVLVIAHRLSTIMKMDRIIVLEKGRVVADGTHSQLLRQEGLYAKLWEIQAGGFLVEDQKANTSGAVEE